MFFAFALLPLVAFSSLGAAYRNLSDDTLKHLPGPGDDFDIKKGALLAPILVPRVSGTKGNAAVRQHFVDFFKSQLPEWRIEMHNSTSTTPVSKGKEVPFVNVIATRDPPGSLEGDVSRLALVAHYDSKLTPKDFIGATDSAAPCAMILHIARSIDAALTKKWAAADKDDFEVKHRGVQILLLDGEEAFQSWTDTDSLYGARALAQDWESSFHMASSIYRTPLDSIELFLLLDLLGAKSPQIPSYFKTTHWAYKHMANTEDRLRKLGLFKSVPLPKSKMAEGEREKPRGNKPFLTDAHKEDNAFRGGFVQDDHVPFMARGVEILHMIPSPFPEVWHTAEDDGEHLDLNTVEDWTKLVMAFTAEWMELEGFFDIKTGTREDAEKSELRGGTHKVKDEDRTDSIYDTYNYKELLDTAKERGIYRKDMKKGEMAWALKRNDEEKKRAQHQAKIEYELKQQQARQEQEKKDAQLQALVIAKHKRRIERMQKRDRDESVSDDTPSESENEAEANEDASDLVGQALSDESWDSTSTESSTYSTSHIPAHDCRLRLFEWPYDYMPHPDPVAKTVADLARLPDPPPRPVPYAPLKLTTTHTRQKLILPGHKYPLTVAPNYVPILPSETRSSAHSYQHQQRLAGLLRNAVVETGAFWASKTVVQGSTARMYFHLGSRNESKSLADTYQKWYLEDRRLLRVGVGTGRAGGLGKDERTWRHEERRRNQGRKVAEVYESSKWRPVAMGFLPAYLDFGEPKGQSAWGRERGRSLANLRYVRFQGCDVPQYYFWVKEGEVGFVRHRGIFGLEWVGGEDETDEEEEEEEEEEAEYVELGGHIIDDSSNDSLTSAKALYRRSSAVRIHSQNNKHAVVEKWLDETSPSTFPSSQAPDFPSTSALAFLDTYPNTADSTDEKNEEEEVERPTRPTSLSHSHQTTTASFFPV
ncbi:Peptide hydrolase [Pyrenophora teres f. maculata]|nr:Peptide hydrolase [Pyrenophora teres f. maculata]